MMITITRLAYITWVVAFPLAILCTYGFTLGH